MIVIGYYGTGTDIECKDLSGFQLIIFYSQSAHIHNCALCFYFCHIIKDTLDTTRHIKLLVEKLLVWQAKTERLCSHGSER